MFESRLCEEIYTCEIDLCRFSLRIFLNQFFENSPFFEKITSFEIQTIPEREKKPSSRSTFMKK